LYVKEVAQYPYAAIAGMVVTMGLLFSTAFLKQRSHSGLSWQKALALGCIQGCAFLGPSRLASTYVIARWLGIPHRRAFQFSFAIFVPLIVAAFVFHGIPGMLCHKDVVSSLIAPCLCASVVAYVIFGWVEHLAVRGCWYYLGWYMFLPVSFMLIKTLW
jgi:undecaprenyl pyrophosphate phosphatase UppP